MFELYRIFPFFAIGQPDNVQKYYVHIPDCPIGISCPFAYTENDQKTLPIQRGVKE
jgi:hypothetical protein